MKRITITRAEKCAWRALYIRYGTTQIAHIGVDPNDGNRPQLFGGIAGRRDCTGGRKATLFSFRVGLPTMHWRSNMGPVRLAIYKAVRRFWHNVDGRYGVRR
jgi:hypothetical protein